MKLARVIVALTAMSALFLACSDASKSPAKRLRDGGYADPEEEWYGDEGDDEYQGYDPDVRVPPKPAKPDAAPEATTPRLTGGPTIIYSSPLPIGLDHRVGVELSLDELNGLRGYVLDARESPLRGSLESGDRTWRDGPDGAGKWFLGTGRWFGGASSGKFYDARIELSRTQGFHYAAGIGTSSLPDSGDAQYAAAPSGATPATVEDGIGGFAAVAAPRAKARFGVESRVALTFTVEGAAGPYVVTTSGGLADPDQSELATFSEEREAHVFGGLVPTKGTGAACVGACTSLVRGFFAGPDAQTIAIAYVVGEGLHAVRGVLVLAK